MGATSALIFFERSQFSHIATLLNQMERSMLYTLELFNLISDDIFNNPRPQETSAARMKQANTANLIWAKSQMGIGDPVTSSILSRYTNMDASGLNTLVNQLTERGIVVKQCMPNYGSTGAINALAIADKYLNTAKQQFSGRL